ncbi:MAG: blc [Verrucomicrobiaceae bacterium]|nr:blc [Verrucomicrobiaceae bacterium]
MGKWYNVAHLPASFQDGCTHSTAIYKMLPNGTVSVVNRCIKDGKVKEVKGSARVVNKKTNAVLEVTFNEWFSAFIPKAPDGNYFVVWLAPDYSAAAVGTPDREYLWILSRSPTLATATYKQITLYCQNLGFDVSKLVVESPHSKRH